MILLYVIFIVLVVATWAIMLSKWLKGK